MRSTRLTPAAAFAVVVLVSPVAGQSRGTAPTDTDLEACRKLTSSPILFVGRPEAPVTIHISGEKEVEEARQNLRRTEEEVARLRGSLDFSKATENDLDFMRRIQQAKSELDRRRAQTPPPYDLELIPVRVEQVFRGAEETTLMVRQTSPPLPVEIDQPYLIGGFPSQIPLLPPPFGGGPFEYIHFMQVAHIVSTDGVQEQIRFLSSLGTRATLFGALYRHSFGESRGETMSGIRVVVQSGPQIVETTTNDDGRFIASGLQPGRVNVRVGLPADFVLIDKPPAVLQIGEGTCTNLLLTASLNGRLRGKITSPTGAPLDQVQLNLTGVVDGRPADQIGSHSPQTTIRANRDGTFEFVGQGPGAYYLSAVINGHVTYFPGTLDPAAAVPITIGRATEHNGFDFAIVAD